jgi:hypothetical protein
LELMILLVVLHCNFHHAFEDVEDSIFWSSFGSCMLYKGTASEKMLRIFS